jgi:exopolysaccharide biosynthesis protein
MSRMGANRDGEPDGAVGGRRRLLPVRLAVVGAWLAVLVAAAGGCEPLDRPPALTRGLPPALVEYVVPDRVSTFRLGEGVIYRAVRSSVEPWSLHLLEVDPTRCEVGFKVATPGPDEPRAPVSELARREGGQVVAAVNGDFFTEESRPIGLEASGGEIRGRSSRPVFAWKPGNLPSVGPVQWDGDSLAVGEWVLSVREPDGVTEILSGFPPLLSDGKWVDDLQQVDRPAFASARHPRTALGWDPERRRVWIAVVEGRREGSAEGMTLPELAELFRALGVTEALNLDGGGSSVMVVRGRRVSRPSDPAGERPVVNALLVRVDAAYCRGVGTEALAREGLGDPGDPAPLPSQVR